MATTVTTANSCRQIFNSWDFLQLLFREFCRVASATAAIRAIFASRFQNDASPMQAKSLTWS